MPSADTPRLLGLSALRLRAPMTQVELAQQARLDPRTIARLERGEVRATPSTIRKIATVLGVAPGALYGEAKDNG